VTSLANLRVLIVDDHPVVREGLRAVLEVRAGCVVVGEAAEGREGIECYERLQPNVAIVDIRLPGVGGIEVIAAIRRLDPDARIIAMTSYSGDVELRRALDAGALGLLLKGAPGEELAHAVRRVAAGQPYIASDAAEELRLGNDPPNLTQRESEVLKLMAEGQRNQEIAEALGLSLGTVKVHVNRILEKLDAVDRTEAVTRALRRGLIALQ
jgi:two-component system, NarL family, response regulator